MNIKITKFRASDDSVQISYQIKTGKEWSKINLESPEKAEPELYQALSMLADDVIEISEFPVAYLDQITVKGCSFNYKDNLVGACIIATRKLDHSKSPLNLVTPFKWEKNADIELKDDALIFLSDECSDRLKTVRDLIKRYIKGKRAQQELFKTSDRIPAGIANDDEDEPDTPKAKRSVSPETEKTFKMNEKQSNHPSGLDVKKVAKKAPFKK